MNAQNPYISLARKYRPQTLSQIQGQPALVRILTNALTQNRLGHAFLLHGIRGTGKTTTARVLAKCLNCTGVDGAGESTPEPCGVCENCVRIGSDNHIDVIEMDAASHTGVDDIREVIESARYKPVSARFKVFIIDEVHMLSKSAFNALLKTLEEPPPHVKFILATTELHKVPETVISRCMRFDLERIGIHDLTALYETVAGKEGYSIDPLALAMIAKAADGSARDGMSILDQAINTADAKHVSAEHVQTMLGLAQQKDTWGVLAHAVNGRIEDCLTIFDTFYAAGGDPLNFVKALLGHTHDLMSLVITESAKVDATIVADDETANLITKLRAEMGMDALYRLWAILVKGHQDIQQSPLPHVSARILLMKICYASSLPTTRDALQNFAASAPVAVAQPRTAAPTTPAAPTSAHMVPRPPASTPMPAASSITAPIALRVDGDGIEFYRNLCDFIKNQKEVLLYSLLEKHTRFIEGRQGYLKIAADAHVPEGFQWKLKSLLENSGETWIVEIGDTSPFPTLSEHAQGVQQQMKDKARQTPLVQEVLKAFPEAQIASVHEKASQ